MAKRSIRKQRFYKELEETSRKNEVKKLENQTYIIVNYEQYKKFINSLDGNFDSEFWSVADALAIYDKDIHSMIACRIYGRDCKDTYKIREDYMLLCN